jgi:hypothetical protein
MLLIEDWCSWSQEVHKLTGRIYALSMSNRNDAEHRLHLTIRLQLEDVTANSKLGCSSDHC